MAQTKKKTTATKAKTTRTKKPATKSSASRTKRKTSPAKTAAKKTATSSKPESIVRKVAPSKTTSNVFPFQGLETKLLTPPQLNPKSMEDMMSKSKKQMDQLTQDAADIGRESMEAFVKSGTIFAKGFEDLMRTSMTLAQSATEKQTRLAKEVMSSKSLHEFTETQSKIAQANYDDFLQSATKISEMGVKLLTEAAEPLNEQMNKTIRKASESMAA